jgi:hypothetical protein|uniref:Uncharacterized protein n=1 Tax=Desulfobacca acetoxidans TaxID=60893 RepID=A0A7C3ZAF1_9BACT
MLKVRFKTPGPGYRPVKWPPPGPYWRSGYDFGGKVVVIAYAEYLYQIYEYWPDAQELDVLEVGTEIAFSDRFPRPDWWK